MALDIPAELCLENVLNQLEEFASEIPIEAKTQHFQQILKAVTGTCDLSQRVMQRILAVSIRDLNDKFEAPHVIHVIEILLKKLKAEDNLMKAYCDLAETVVKLLSKLSNSKSHLKKEIVDIFLALPDNTLVGIVGKFTPQLILIIYWFLQNEAIHQGHRILKKLLRILPPDDKNEFIRQCYDNWFEFCIPELITLVAESNEEALEVLELLTQELQNVNYYDNPAWQKCILEPISRTDQYPAILKRLLLEPDNDTWDRLWIMFVKLLKNQITLSKTKSGSPINSLLSVVEMAFKMDVSNRCRAFQCWNVLIDNFCTETNESLLTKRLKLLIVPLKSNNAKVEQTAIVKFGCWWHLILKFQDKMDTYADGILLPFLQYCFGKDADNGKPVMVPGKLSNTMKLNAVNAYLEIIGHESFVEDCVNITKLKHKLLTTNMLVNHWTVWKHSLKCAIMYCCELDLTKHLKCIWKSFNLTIAGLPDNNVRKDLFNEVSNMLIALIRESNQHAGMLYIIIHILIYTLFDKEIEMLLKSDDINGPLHKLISMLIYTDLQNVLRNSTEDDMIRLKKIMKETITKTKANSLDIVTWLLEIMPHNDGTLMLWTAVAQSIIELKLGTSPSLFKLIIWPLQKTNVFCEVELPTETWYNLYESTYPRSYYITNREITNILINKKIMNVSCAYFMLKIIIAFSKCYDSDSGLKDGKRTETFKKALLPILVDKLVSVLSLMILKINLSLANKTTPAINRVLKIMGNEFKNQENFNDIMTLFEKLWKPLCKLCQMVEYFKLIENVMKELVEHAKIISKLQRSIRTEIVSLMKTYLACISKKKMTACGNIKLAIAIIENVETSSELDPVEYCKPDSIYSTVFDANQDKKKLKLNTTKIVDTVVENGEEYVVVKTDWKFNPRKLTESQREKLKKKQADIPALYQDLSQSQDEFKLKTWKLDSQDSSISNDSNSHFTSAFQNLPNEQLAKTTLINNKTSKVVEDKHTIQPTAIKEQLPCSDKGVQFRPASLKDRLSKNLKELLKKTSLTDLSDDMNKTTNIVIPTSPKVQALNTENLTNSAPSKMTSDRPSRVKRMPKKFDESEIFAMKKNRHSLLNDNNSLVASEEDNVLNQQSCSSTTDKNDVPPISEQITIPNEVITKALVHKSSSNDGKECTVADINQESAIDNDYDLSISVPGAAEKSIQGTVPNTKLLNDNMELHCELKGNQNEKITETVTMQDVEFSPDTSLPHETKTGPIVHSEKNETSTPKSVNKNKDERKKGPKKKKSRIEKELAIDMVEGHPFLQAQPEKRTRRKSIFDATLHGNRRQSLIEKLDKSKLENSKTDNMSKNKVETRTEESETNGAYTSSLEEQQDSEDVIESSQDSSITTISMKSMKVPLVKVHALDLAIVKKPNQVDANISLNSTLIKESLEADSVLLIKKDNLNVSDNKTVNHNLTENLDTEPMDENSFSHSDGILKSNDVIRISAITNEDTTFLDSEAQNTANADTVPIDSNVLVSITHENTPDADTQSLNISTTIIRSENSHSDKDLNNGMPTNSDIISDTEGDITKTVSQSIIQKLVDGEKSNSRELSIDSILNSEEDATKTMSESVIQKVIEGGDISNSTRPALILDTQDDVSNTLPESMIEKLIDEDNTSPFKDEAQRKKDFLNNTLEISPIRAMSPVTDKRSPSPETSTDYVVIKLTSPVQSNGEPYIKSDSPEIFTEDNKISPDKRDQSPPRDEGPVSNNTSPSLSLKKNKPQVRCGGRAAQMLGLCVPNRLQTLLNVDKCTETEEPKRSNTAATSARRNLRILYNTNDKDNDSADESEESENFLKFKKSLPAVDSSPSVPILKRKLADICDETTVSPASKRKRVSFHDPPVSTTISVQKYIEPLGIRSPQSSASKKQERPTHTPNMKSPKRLDNVFKLDSVLTKAVESFISLDTDDTEMSSLEQTPAFEVVNTSELNDKDPICPELLECCDPIALIAADLSSPSMGTLLTKELEGKIETIGDLAKMTELEVNRLCIKTPKVKVAKKALTDYYNKKLENEEIIVSDDGDPSVMPASSYVSVEMQTIENVLCNADCQTEVRLSLAATQTDNLPVSYAAVQTEESGWKSTRDIIKSFLKQRTDFEESLMECLPLLTKAKLIAKKIVTDEEGAIEVDQISKNENQEMSLLKHYLCSNLDTNELMIFCSQLLIEKTQKNY